MAEESDLEKSEQASSTRLEKAYEEGDVPRSKELATCVLLFTAGLSVWGLGSHLTGALKDMLSTGLIFDSKLAFNTDSTLSRISDQIIDLLLAFAPLGFALIIAALAAPVLVGGWNFSTNLLIPNFERLDPIKGMGNLFSKNSLVELVLSVAKATVVGVVAYFVISADFAQLSTIGRAVGAFKGVAQASLTDLPSSTPEYLQAQLAVPAHAAFFEDHFPRRPVFPATLLLDALLQLALRVGARAAGGAMLRLTRITNVKVRAFTAPGAILVLSAQVAAPGSDDLEPYMVKLTAQAEGKTIAGAKMYFAPAGETV